MTHIPTKLPRYRELPIAARYPAKTAWGLFGDDDNVGMLNLQTPERIAAAAKLVRSGKMFAMNWAQDLPNPPLFMRGALRHKVLRELPIGHHGDDVLDNFYPQASSQWDGLSHVGDFEHGFWGGVQNQALREPDGKAKLGIDFWARRGIAGRAVLLDVARVREAAGRAIDCALDDTIEVADLEAARQLARVEFQPGDVWLIHTGWVSWYEATDLRTRYRLANPDQIKLPGLRCSEAMAEYIFDQHPAAVCADNPSVESWPPPGFFQPEGFLHHWLIGRFGMALGEMFVLDALARDCAADGVYEGFFTAAPLHIRGGVGSPPNALVLK